MTIGALSAVAATSTSNPDYVGAGVLGFLVVAALALALVFLVRSMNKHLRKVPGSFSRSDSRSERPPTTPREPDQ